jgi:hypothetical protein
MDRKQIEDEHIVARYLADQLSPAEVQAFEAYYTEHPSMVEEIEHTLRLREGLATLRDRQQLDALMKARLWRRAMPLSIAAAVAVVLIGTWTWYDGPAASPVAGTLTELAAGSQPTLSLGGKYLLVRVRSGESAPLQIPIPAARSALELQVLPAGGATGAPYRLRFDRVNSQGKPEHVGEISGLTPGADGLVSAWLDSARLQPGSHTVELTSEQADAAAPAERFVIELR